VDIRPGKKRPLIPSVETTHHHLRIDDRDKSQVELRPGASGRRARAGRRVRVGGVIGLAVAALVSSGLTPSSAHTPTSARTSSAPAKAKVAPTADAAVPTNNAPVAYRETVASLSKTIRWYHQVLGLELAGGPTPWSLDQAEARLTGVRAWSRSVTIKVPNESFVLLFTQYRDVRQHPQEPHGADIGQMNLTLSVKNAVAAYAALRAAHTPTLLPGGTIPPGTGTGTITVFVRDPDGMPVEVVQRSGPSDWFTVDPPTVIDGPGMKYAIRGQIDFVAKTDQASLAFYRDLVGFDINPGFPPLVGPNEHPVMPDFLADFFGITHGSTWAAATGNCASEVRCEFFEYDDPARVNFRPRIADPGAPSFEVASTNLVELVKRLTAAGTKIVTPGGRPVNVDGTPEILVRDNSGLLVRIAQAKLVSWNVSTVETYAAPGQPFPVGSTTLARVVYKPAKVKPNGNVVITGHQHFLGSAWADPNGPAGTPVSNRSVFNVDNRTLDYQVSVTHGVPIFIAYTPLGFVGIYSQADGSMLEGGHYTFDASGPQVCNASTWAVDGTC
jgi:catechol 2,3-dioxygenase-like lactoylglutathione lyase family enzyme